MQSSCYDWIALAGMAFSAQGVSFPTVPRVELGEPIEFVNSIGAWNLTITPEVLLCELIIGGEHETKALFTVDLVCPSSEQVLRSIDYLINLGKVYVPNSSHNYFP